MSNHKDTSGDPQFLIGFLAGLLTVTLYMAMNLNVIAEAIIVVPISMAALALSRRI
jgi:hypothetical protein